jgi:hypothetical protein
MPRHREVRYRGHSGGWWEVLVALVIVGVSVGVGWTTYLLIT